MNISPNQFVNSYIDWLKSKITFKEMNDYIEISTPFLDRHNDHLQIYVKQTNDKILLTDDGYIINDLVMSGYDINSPQRKNVLQTIVNSLGVKLDGDALITEAHSSDFPQKKHLLLQAMISVNDMFMLSQRKVASLFLEDVESFLDRNEIRYTPSIQVVGKSGFSHNIDFVIPSSKQKPERLLKAINNPSKDRAQILLFAWNDIREVRKKESEMYVFLNDIDKDIRSDVLSAFTQYEINVVLWSKRQQYVKELIA